MTTIYETAVGLAPSRFGLTRRQTEVLTLVADGRTNGEIGTRLSVSEETVKTHVQRILRKTGSRDRAHAVAQGFRAGVLQ